MCNSSAGRGGEQNKTQSTLTCTAILRT